MEQDIAGKVFFSDNRRYADLINGLGCNGEQIISGKDLQEMDTQTGFWGKTTGGRKRRYNKKHGYGIKIRDLVRKTAFGINFAVIGIENQSNIDYTFPVRAMSYDVGEYERQLKGIRRRLRKKGKDGQHLTPAEYLCGFQKDTRLYSVVTFVLYYGKDEWDAAADLHGMLDFTDIPDGIQKLVQNYHIHVVDVPRMRNTEVFKTDVRQVFDFIRCSKDDRSMRQLMAKDPEYGKMEEEAYNMAAAYTGSENLLAVKDDYIEGGRVNMCKAIDDLILKGKLEGRVEGELDKTKTIVKNMLQRGMADADICALAECDEVFLEGVRKEL